MMGAGWGQWKEVEKRNARSGRRAKTQRYCRDPSAACRKRRGTSVGMTVLAMPQKARHSGRDDSVGLDEGAKAGTEEEGLPQR